MPPTVKAFRTAILRRVPTEYCLDHTAHTETKRKRKRKNPVPTSLAGGNPLPCGVVGNRWFTEPHVDMKFHTIELKKDGEEVGPRCLDKTS